jgi:hypothetical protein
VREAVRSNSNYLRVSALFSLKYLWIFGVDCGWSRCYPSLNQRVRGVLRARIELISPSVTSCQELSTFFLF